MKKNFEAKVIMGIGLFIVCVALNACGTGDDGIIDGAQGPSGKNGTSCSAQVVSGQNEVVCTDGTSFPVDNGSNGSNGYSIGTLTEAASGSQCGNGGTVIEFYQDVNYSGEYADNDPITSSVLVCNGLVGATGSSGSAGQNGTSSSVSVVAATLTQCPTGGLDITTLNGAVSSSNVVCNGSVGPQGVAGPTGLTGSVGATGSQGAPGINANLSVVQFCPSSFVPSYPSTFPEIGLCLNNVLYGVYSANDGFLAMLPPGEYSSDGINASCTFTIGADCKVSY